MLKSFCLRLVRPAHIPSQGKGKTCFVLGQVRNELERKLSSTFAKKSLIVSLNRNRALLLSCTETGSLDIEQINYCGDGLCLFYCRALEAPKAGMDPSCFAP